MNINVETNNETLCTFNSEYTNHTNIPVKSSEQSAN